MYNRGAATGNTPFCQTAEAAPFARTCDQVRAFFEALYRKPLGFIPIEKKKIFSKIQLLQFSREKEQK